MHPDLINLANMQKGSTNMYKTKDELRKALTDALIAKQLYCEKHNESHLVRRISKLEIDCWCTAMDTANLSRLIDLINRTTNCYDEVFDKALEKGYLQVRPTIVYISDKPVLMLKNNAYMQYNNFEFIITSTPEGDGEITHGLHSLQQAYMRLCFSTSNKELLDKGVSTLFVLGAMSTLYYFPNILYQLMCKDSLLVKFLMDLSIYSKLELSYDTMNQCVTDMFNIRHSYNKPHVDWHSDLLRLTTRDKDNYALIEFNSLESYMAVHTRSLVYKYNTRKVQIPKIFMPDSYEGFTVYQPYEIFNMITLVLLTLSNVRANYVSMYRIAEGKKAVTNISYDYVRNETSEYKDVTEFVNKFVDKLWIA